MPSWRAAPAIGLTSVALLPFAVIANFAGIWLVRKTPTELFYRIAYVLMFLISLALLWQGVERLVAFR